MNVHISDELPRLLTGEASRDAVFEAAAHLRECADCQQELVSAVVAHASITSAHRFAPEIVHSDRAEVSLAEDAPLPDLSTIFAQVREEATAPAPRVRHLPHANRRVLLGAAAAVVLVGAGVGSFLAVDGGSSSPGQSVALAAFQTGRTPGSARINGSTITVNATSLPAQAGKRYEVWLTNQQRTEMQPIGWIAGNGTAKMTVPTDLISRFSDIEVSVQPVASPDYLYSNVSVLRGAYSS